MPPTERCVLIIEDDGEVRRMVREALMSQNWRVLEADNVNVGLHQFRTQKPDLVVLDVNLPDGTGFDICQKIRESKTLFSTPVIMLTAEAGMEEKAAGFAAGADQYLVKPVKPQELILWVQALMKRLDFEQNKSEQLVVGDLAIDPKALLVYYQGQVLPRLTTKEFELLFFLAKKRPQVLTRKHILSTLWHTISVDNVVDTHISNLRKKLPSAISDRIQNVPGKGFRYFDA